MLISRIITTSSTWSTPFHTMRIDTTLLFATILRGLGCGCLTRAGILAANADGYTLIRSARPKEFTDLDLYLMGFIPETEVGTHIIFNNQNQNPRGGGKLEGSVTTVSAQMIVEKLGPRIPNSQQSPKEFRIATVIVSEELLSEEAMRLYDYFAARAEEIKAVPYSSGFVRAIALPFHITTGKRGSLMTKIDAPISETKK